MDGHIKNAVVLLINYKDWRPNSCLMEDGREFYLHSFLKQMKQKVVCLFVCFITALSSLKVVL